jgi:hypothetical protein
MEEPIQSEWSKRQSPFSVLHMSKLRMEGIPPSGRPDGSMVHLLKTWPLDSTIKQDSKKRWVSKEVHNANWIKNLGSIHCSALLEEFVLLYLALSTVTLSDQKDVITWKWSPDGRLSVASAYDCQFTGAMSYFPASKIWKATTEPKCKFFAWLIIHNKAPTADNLAKKNWGHNPTCPLCYCLPKTAEHLLT